MVLYIMNNAVMKSYNYMASTYTVQCGEDYYNLRILCSSSLNLSSFDITISNHNSKKKKNKSNSCKVTTKVKYKKYSALTRKERKTNK